MRNGSCALGQAVGDGPASEGFARAGGFGAFRFPLGVPQERQFGWKHPPGSCRGAPTCLLASTTSGSRGSWASSACSSWRAVSRRSLSTESTTKTSTWAPLR